jgi:hypothetical protein
MARKMMKLACVLLSNEVKPALLAAKTLQQKSGYSINIYLQTSENLANS